VHAASPELLHRPPCCHRSDGRMHRNGRCLVRQRPLDNPSGAARLRPEVDFGDHGGLSLRSIVVTRNWTLSGPLDGRSIPQGSVHPCTRAVSIAFGAGAVQEDLADCVVVRLPGSGAAGINWGAAVVESRSTDSGAGSLQRIVRATDALDATARAPQQTGSSLQAAPAPSQHRLLMQFPEQHSPSFVQASIVKHCTTWPQLLVAVPQRPPAQVAATSSGTHQRPLRQALPG